MYSNLYGQTAVHVAKHVKAVAVAVSPGSKRRWNTVHCCGRRCGIGCKFYREELDILAENEWSDISALPDDEVLCSELEELKRKQTEELRERKEKKEARIGK